MTAFLQLLVIGMATGGFYTINALGIVVVFRSSGVINFASGGAAMVGGYMSWEFADQMGWPQAVAIAVAIVIAAFTGLVIYTVAILPLTNASTLTKVIATLAALVSLQQAVVLIFGGLPKVPKTFLPTRSIHLGSIRVGEDSLIFLVFTVVLTMVLWATYRYTSFGLATSALAESPRSLAALGWRVGGLRAGNWAIGGALAGVAGAGIGPFLQLNTVNFTALLIPTLASAVLGGLRSFPLTLAGGLFVGAAQAEAERYITYAGAGDAVPFILIILVLVIRGRTLPLRSFVQERLPRVGSGQIRPVRLVLAVVVIAVVASQVNVNWVIGATTTLFVAIILLSQVVITGYAGQLSLAQLTIGGVGAVVATRIAAGVGLPFILALPVGMIAAIPVSLLLGLPSLRARGVSLAIATLGFAVAINALVLTNGNLTGGLTGLTLKPQELFGWVIDATTYPLRYFYVTLAIFTLLAIAVANVRRGRTGRRMLAVRNNERAASALGINVTGTKLYAFTLAGSIAAAGAVAMAFSVSLPQFTGYDPITSLNNLVSVVLGGIGYVFGALFGGLFAPTGLPNAILFRWTTNWSWWNSVFPLFTGLGLIVQLIFNPNGVVDVITHGSAKQARKRAAKAALEASAAETSTAEASTTEAGTAETVDQLTATSTTSGPTTAGPTTSGIASKLSLSALAPGVRRRQRTARRLADYRAQLETAAAQPREFRRSSLSAQDVHVRFGTVVAVDGVSLTVAPGEVLAVIGPNGAGKTTLMDAITGFVAMRGTVEVDGKRIDGRPAFRRARAGVARSFQSLELLEDMSVLDNLRCAAEPQDLRSLFVDLVHPNRSQITSATAAAISAFGLTDKLDKMPTEIGYGDRRLVAIARAVAGEPSVLLLDEPAAGLSDHERNEVARLITLMAREWHMAVLLIEHDVSLVRRVSDRVIALDFGRPIASGTPDEVLSHPAVIEAYLGAPDDDAPPHAAAGSSDTEPPVRHQYIG